MMMIILTLIILVNIFFYNNKMSIPTLTELNKMKKEELIGILNGLGLDTEGTKPTLIRRIVESNEKVAQGQKNINKNEYYTADDCPKKYEDLKNDMLKYKLSTEGTHAELCRRWVDYQMQRSQSKSPKYEQTLKGFTFDKCNTVTIEQLKTELRSLNITIGASSKEELCKKLSDHYKSKVESDVKKLNDVLIIDNDIFTGKSGRGGKYEGAIKLELSNKMLSFIKNGGQEYDMHHGKKCKGKAYVFGSLLDTSMYVSLGTLSGKNLSIINYDDVKNYKGKEYWKMANIIGESTIYIHRNTLNDIDGIVIDQSCIFSL